MNSSELSQRVFRKFLNKEKSNFVSHSISKLHTTYSNNQYKKKKNFFNYIKNLKFIFDIDKNYFKKNQKTDLLIISNILSEKNLNHDLYFGNLDTMLDKEGIKTLKIFRNFSNKSSTNLLKRSKNKKYIISKRETILNEIKIFIKFLVEIYKYLFSKKYLSVKKYLMLTDLISIIPNLRVINQIRNIIKKINPSMVMFTYEGHAWERLLTYICKKEFKIVSIGYQFSPIKKNQFGLFNDLKNIYNPDFIGTSGKIPFQEISKKIKFSKIFLLGSSKSSLRNRGIINTKTNDLLVALDDDRIILDKMLEYSIKFAENNFTKNIILRVHPVYRNKKKIINLISSKIKNKKNIKFSLKSLDNDLAKSKFLLFVDSSVGIECLNYNVIPLFFKNSTKQNIYDKNFPKKNIVNKRTDLQKIIDTKVNKKLSKYFKNYKYNYFQNYNINKIKNVIYYKKI